MLMVYLSVLDTNEDKSKFEKLYLKYRQAMYAVAFSILQNEHDAEDAVHAAFLNIAKNFSKTCSINPDNMKAYLIVVIRNVSINIYKKKKRKRKHEKTLTDCNAIVDIDFFENFEFEDLVRTISSLPDTSKEILFLFYLEKLTTDEISDLLNITNNAVLKRIERAKQLLKNALEGEENYAGNEI